MEGTSGAADRGSLRGDLREAALNAGSRESGVWRGGPVDVAPFKEGSSSTEATPATDENRPATGGVRADQVGEKLPLRAIAAWRGRPWGTMPAPNL